jgi:hypothetical protein
MKRCVVRGHESETIQPFKVDFLVRSHREEEKKALVFSYIFYSFLWLRDCVSMPILSVEYLSGICFENVSTLFGRWRVRCSVRPKAQVLLEEEETRRTTYSLDYIDKCVDISSWPTGIHQRSDRGSIIHTGRARRFRELWNTKCQTEFLSFFYQLSRLVSYSYIF